MSIIQKALTPFVTGLLLEVQWLWSLGPFRQRFIKARATVVATAVLIA